VSTYPHISTNEILTLKLAAKNVKRKAGISHSEALDQVAREKGFNAWSHLMHIANSTQAVSLENSIPKRKPFSWLKDFTHTSEEKLQLEKDFFDSNFEDAPSELELYFNFSDEIHLNFDAECNNAITKHQLHLDGIYTKLDFQNYKENPSLLEKYKQYFLEAIDCFGAYKIIASLNSEGVENWLTTPNEELGNIIPLVALQKPEIVGNIYKIIETKYDEAESNALISYTEEPSLVPENVRHLVKDAETAMRHKQQILDEVLAVNMRQSLNDKGLFIR
jgi:hypothetical protein